MSEHGNHILYNKRARYRRALLLTLFYRCTDKFQNFSGLFILDDAAAGHFDEGLIFVFLVDGLGISPESFQGIGCVFGITGCENFLVHHIDRHGIVRFIPQQALANNGASAT